MATRKGRRTLYRGAQAQRPGSRRKTQVGRPFVDYRGRKKFFATVEQFNRMNEPRPRIEGVVHSEHAIGFNLKDRRRGKPERRIRERRKGDRRKGQVGEKAKHWPWLWMDTITMSKRDFKRLKEPKPRLIPYLKEPDRVTFQERRDNANDRRQNKGSRRTDRSN
jgi:hypothetical protein